MKMKTNRVRQEAGIVYAILGGAVLLICGLIQETLGWPGDGFVITITILWSLGWSAIAIGAGLINTRYHNKTSLDRTRKHYYFLYYPFALSLIFLTSLSLSFSINEGVSKLAPTFYSTVPLVSLILGLYAENFAALAGKILEKLTL